MVTRIFASVEHAVTAIEGERAGDSDLDTISFLKTLDFAAPSFEPPPPSETADADTAVTVLREAYNDEMPADVEDLARRFPVSTVKAVSALYRAFNDGRIVTFAQLPQLRMAGGFEFVR